MEKKTRTLRYFLKYMLFFVILFRLYILQSIPGFLSLFGIKPVFTIPFCIALASLLDEWQAYVIFIIGGLLTDLSSMRVAGYFTIILVLGCIITMIAVKFFLKATMRNAFFCCLAVMVSMLTLDFFFSYVMAGHTGMLGFFFKKVILVSFYSSVFAIPFFFIIDNINIIRSLRVSER